MMTRREWLGSATLGLLPAVISGYPGTSHVIEGFAVYSAMVGRRSWVLFELRTDQGLTGLGDATSNEAVPELTATFGREVFETIRGRAPFEVERLRQASLAKVAATDPGNRRKAAAACSGLEQALWDLQGKVLGLPCHALFGGKLRDEVRNYANINRVTRGAERTAEGFAKYARLAVEADFDAVKLAPFDHMSRNESDPKAYEEGVSSGIGFATAVREAIGTRRDLLIDGHGRFDGPQAIEVGRRLGSLNLYWMEEMCRSHEDLALLKGATEVQTAGGEGLWSVNEFMSYIRADTVDAVMPDVKFCGGMYELKKIAAIAEAAGLLASPHGPASPVGNMAAAHVCATLPNFDILELAFGEVPWRAECVRPAEELVGGRLRVPDRPGIGYEMNPEYWTRRAP